MKIRKTLFYFFALLLIPVLLCCVWILVFQYGKICWHASSFGEFKELQHGDINIIRNKDRILQLLPQKAENIKVTFNRNRPQGIDISFALKNIFLQNYIANIDNSMAAMNYHALNRYSGKDSCFKIYESKDENAFFKQIRFEYFPIKEEMKVNTY